MRGLAKKLACHRVRGAEPAVDRYRLSIDIAGLVAGQEQRDIGEFLGLRGAAERRSEEHTSELQSLMRNSYAVFCLKKKSNRATHTILLYRYKQECNKSQPSITTKSQMLE